MSNLTTSLCLDCIYKKLCEIPNNITMCECTAYKKGEPIEKERLQKLY